MHISYLVENMSVAKSGERRRRRCRERPTNLARRWSSLNSLGATRSWNVLWKLLWKALRACTELGPRVRFCYTRAVTATSPPETPRGPILILPSSLYLSLFARASQQAAFSLSILESASFFIIIISVVDTSSLARDRVFLFFLPFPFFSHSLVLLGYISWPVFSSAEIFRIER